MVQAGFSPSEAIQSATKVGSEVLEIENDAGILRKKPKSGWS